MTKLSRYVDQAYDVRLGPHAVRVNSCTDVLRLASAVPTRARR
jgi:hypothetical protein